nr:triose-phosphate isomerase [Desulfobulbaceae bacterium]
MKRRPLIAGNWKMNLSVIESRKLAEAIKKSASNATDRDVMIAPAFTSLSMVASALEGSRVLLGGQNVCWEEKGAYTAEISPPMLKELGCTFAIVGHSERRHIFHEDNVMINKRVKAAINFDLTPILCIGETLEERESNNTMPILESQLREGLQNLSLPSASAIVIAYEPVWAIGTGKTASNEQAQEAHAFTRKILADIFEKTIASQIRILYGGSVNPDNVDNLMSQDDIDGALVGGAALQPDTFDRIIHFN